jgi:hypothetical protein
MSRMNKNIPGEIMVSGTNIGPYLLTCEDNKDDSYSVILRYNNVKLIDRKEKHSKDVDSYNQRAKLDYDMIRQVLLHYDGINPYREQCDFDLIDKD